MASGAGNVTGVSVTKSEFSGDIDIEGCGCKANHPQKRDGGVDGWGAAAVIFQQVQARDIHVGDKIDHMMEKPPLWATSPRSLPTSWP